MLHDAILDTLCLLVIFLIAKLTVEMAIRLIAKIKERPTAWRMTPQCFALDSVKLLYVGMILETHAENCEIIITDINYDDNTITVEHYDGGIKNKVK